MNIKTITSDMESNIDEIQRLEIEIKQVNPEVPELDGYTENDFILYLNQQDIFLDNPDYETLKNQLIDNYEKRQDYINSRSYYVTLNSILEKLIAFNVRYLRDPDNDELDTLAEGTGIQDHIDTSIQYVKDNFL